MRCLFCGKRLSLIRKIAGAEFCSPEHEQLYRQDQESLGLARLIEEKQYSKRETARRRREERQASRPGVPPLREQHFVVPPKARNHVRPYVLPGDAFPLMARPVLPQLDWALAARRRLQVDALLPEILPAAAVGGPQTAAADVLPFQACVLLPGASLAVSPRERPQPAPLRALEAEAPSTAVPDADLAPATSARRTVPEARDLPPNLPREGFAEIPLPAPPVAPACADSGDNRTAHQTVPEPPSPSEFARVADPGFGEEAYGLLYPPPQWNLGFAPEPLAEPFTMSVSAGEGDGPEMRTPAAGNSAVPPPVRRSEPILSLLPAGIRGPASMPYFTGVPAYEILAAPPDAAPIPPALAAACRAAAGLRPAGRLAGEPSISLPAGECDWSMTAGGARFASEPIVMLPGGPTIPGRASRPQTSRLAPCAGLPVVMPAVITAEPEMAAVAACAPFAGQAAGAVAHGCGPGPLNPLLRTARPARAHVSPADSGRIPVSTSPEPANFRAFIVPPPDPSVAIVPGLGAHAGPIPLRGAAEPAAHSAPLRPEVPEAVRFCGSADVSLPTTSIHLDASDLRLEGAEVWLQPGVASPPAASEPDPPASAGRIEFAAAHALPENLELPAAAAPGAVIEFAALAAEPGNEDLSKEVMPPVRRAVALTDEEAPDGAGTASFEAPLHGAEDHQSGRRVESAGHDGEKLPVRPFAGLVPLGIDEIRILGPADGPGGVPEPMAVRLKPVILASALHPVPEAAPSVHPKRRGEVPRWVGAYRPVIAAVRSIPPGVRWAALAAPLVVALLLQFGRNPATVAASVPDTRVSDVLATRWENMQLNIADRAAIALTDDFRSGLSNWEGAGDWANSWSYDKAGFIRPGKLALFRPSVPLRDYTATFRTQIESRAVGWVFRASDTANYYAAELVITEPGPLPKAAIHRYAVVDGKKGPTEATPLPFSLRNGRMYDVQVDVRGSGFTISVDGQVVDFFRDTRRRWGGVGFFAARGGRARLRWVNITHQYDFLGRLCALLMPYDSTNPPRSWNP